MPKPKDEGINIFSAASLRAPIRNPTVQDLKGKTMLEMRGSCLTI
jgi:ABC-type molybdate transport system substrate-binding protein